MSLTDRLKAQLQTASLFITVVVINRFFRLFIRFLFLAPPLLLLAKTRDGIFLGIETVDQVEQLCDLQRAVDAVRHADEFESSARFLDSLESADDFADPHTVNDRHFSQVE